MKVLLIEPIYFFQRWPLELYGTRRYFYASPLSLLQLASYYPKKTQVIDGINDLSWTPQKLAKKVLEYNNWDCVIGIGAHSNVGAINTLLTLRLIKAFAPNATIILGGYHATFYPEKWVKLGADIVIRNEAELTYSNLLTKFNDKIEILERDLVGTTYSRDWLIEIKAHSRKKETSFIEKLEDPKDWKKIYEGKYINFAVIPIRQSDRPFVCNLDDFPLPIRTKLDFTRNYLPLNTPGYTTTIESGRGCPFHCEFCSTVKMWGSQQRYKSANYLIKEIKQGMKLGIKRFYFIDESWGINVQRDMEFISLIKKEQLNISWGVQIRPDTIVQNPELIKMAGENECKMALVGFETIHQKLLDFCNKETNITQIIKARRILSDANIFTFGYFLIGIPGETPKMRKMNFQSLEGLSDMALVQPYLKYFSESFKKKESSENYPFFLRNKNPTFMIDTKQFLKTTKNLEEYKNMILIERDLKKFIAMSLLNPRNILFILFPRNETGIIKKLFLIQMYKNFLFHLLRFNPRHFLYWIRGK